MKRSLLKKRLISGTTAFFVFIQAGIVLAEDTVSAPPVVDLQTPINAGDWGRARQSVVIADPTAPVLGHAPGIRTFAKITDLANGITDTRNGGSASVNLSICDTVQAQYQILDIDGDWDLLTSATDRSTVSTKNSIVWFFNDGTQDWVVPNDMLDDPSILKLYDGLFIVAQDGSSANLREWIRNKTAENTNVRLGYRIMPVTAVGSPAYPTDKNGPFSVKVDDLSKLFELPAATEPGDSNTQDLSTSVIKNDISESGITLATDQYFISDSTINFDDSISCGEPQTEQRTKFKIRYYLADGKNAGKQVTWLATGRKYEVHFFYSDTGFSDPLVEGTDITEELLKDDAKDINGKPFLYGLRLQLHVPNSVIGDQPSGPGAGLIGVKSIPQGANIGDVTVEKPGIPLKEYYQLDIENTDLFYRSSDKTKLFFEAKEGSGFFGSPLKQEFLDDKNILNILSRYFDDSNWANQIGVSPEYSFQGFYFNVTSQIPAWPLQAATTIATNQGGQ